MKNKHSLNEILLIILIVGIFFGVFSIINKPVNDRKGKIIKLTVVENKIEQKPIEPKINILNESPIKQTEVEKPKKIIPPYVCPKPKKIYADMSLLAIGQNLSLPDVTYIPKDLNVLDASLSTKKEICLIKEALNSFKSMSKQAKTDGLIIKVSSGFRSYETQKATLAAEIASGNPDAEIAVAKAGYSEHQLGTAVDITGQSIQYVSASKNFEKTAEAMWIEKHASEYGFIESYPIGKESITGYQYEPWHYRYVGIDIAKEIIKNGQTTIEYLETI